MSATAESTGTNLFRHDPGAIFVPAGTLIFAASDPADGMYVVQDGEVEIRIGSTTVETVGPTGIFGEMALVDGQPRSATAIAVTDCKLVLVDELRLMRLIEGNPFFALDIMRVMARRLRESDRNVYGAG